MKLLSPGSGGGSFRRASRGAAPPSRRGGTALNAISEPATAHEIDIAPDAPDGDAAASKDEADTAASLVDAVRHVFDEAQSAVQAVMQSDLFYRFKSSQQYQQLRQTFASMGNPRSGARGMGLARLSSGRSALSLHQVNAMPTAHFFRHEPASALSDIQEKGESALVSRPPLPMSPLGGYSKINYKDRDKEDLKSEVSGLESVREGVPLQTQIPTQST